jgi:dTDP-4-dehydrorhamnose 3,5-epimerase-like enzyme
MLKFKLISLDKIVSIGLKLYHHKKVEDDRGYLNIETEANINLTDSVSIKESFSKPFVGRGMHLQASSSPQTKIIQVQHGKILDIVFDPKDSLKTVFGFYLSDTDHVSVMIPPRFAHGFIATQATNFKYTCFGKYSEKDEITFNMLSSISKIMSFGEIKLSKKDKTTPKIEISNS